MLHFIRGAPELKNIIVFALLGPFSFAYFNSKSLKRGGEGQSSNLFYES